LLEHARPLSAGSTVSTGNSGPGSLVRPPEPAPSQARNRRNVAWVWLLWSEVCGGGGVSGHG